MRARFGQPENIWDSPAGRVFEYNRQPAGQKNYMITIGADGKMSALRQVLTPENFARVQPGMAMEDLRRLLGKPARRTPYPLKNETEWEWRWVAAAEFADGVHRHAQRRPAGGALRLVARPQHRSQFELGSCCPAWPPGTPEASSSAKPERTITSSGCGCSDSRRSTPSRASTALCSCAQRIQAGGVQRDQLHRIEHHRHAARRALDRLHGRVELGGGAEEQRAVEPEGQHRRLQRHQLDAEQRAHAPDEQARRPARCPTCTATVRSNTTVRKKVPSISSR